MPEEYMNIYKTARRAAGLTQEAAAEQLGISVESVRAYETGQRIPPNDVVEQMVICYNALRLAFQHLHETNVLAAQVIPDIQQRSALEASAKLTNRIYEFADKHSDRRLMRITEDNHIDDSERPELNTIMEELAEIMQAAMELRCCVSGKSI